MKSYRLLGNVVAALVFGLFSLSSHAILITSSTPYTFSWDFSSATAGALTGNGSLTVTGFNTNSLTVLVTLTNTSTPGSDRLTAFGFGIDPNATSVSFSDTGDETGMVAGGASFIPSLAGIEVCGYSGPNCRGGGGGGILGNGGTDTFSLILSGVWGGSVNIDPVGFKYQTGEGSYEFTLPPPTSVPEPATLGLLSFGLGLIGLGGLRRRRQQTA